MLFPLQQTSSIEETINARSILSKVTRRCVLVLSKRELIVCVSRDSPSLLGRTLLTRHSQLTIPASPSSVSKCSTPVELEADEMVSQLSDQVCTHTQSQREGGGEGEGRGRGRGR